MPFAQAVRGRAPGGREQQMVLRQDLPPQRSGAADRTPVPDPGPPSAAAPRALSPSRLLPWLARLGVPAAAFAVFQGLLGILPENLGGEAARYCVAATAGAGVGAVVWLAAALLRARGAAASAVAPALPVPVPAPAGSLPELVDGTYQALRRGLTVIEVPGRGPLTGWPHSLAESEPPVHPTAFGTAYGLHLLLDIAPYDGRIRAGEVAETLWRLRLPGGGWAARSQGSGARPEVSAIVLGALARAGADARLLEAEIRSCEVLWDPDHDASGLANTYVVTNVLRGLLRAAPGAAALDGLREVLVNGATADPARDHHRCWGAALATGHGNPAPSAVHTARAVVALDRAARVLGEDERQRAVREEGLRWLLAGPAASGGGASDLLNCQEEVRRPVQEDPLHQELLSVRHFAAAWVARALMTDGARQVADGEVGLPVWEAQLTAAVARVHGMQQGGVWRWDDGPMGHPVWMAYQGLSVLRRYALMVYRP
ncbi:hypothetical protein [Streptomyces tubercidicus]|uniref:hypothetical protein n=1 Tax=Streptomyces tubercidicus TaxID=47759 RepID=UPI002E18C083|nr:hypothetical protein OG690_32735 [Streptomyces tubercidicus]